jgi:hypothetical protein
VAHELKRQTVIERRSVFNDSGHRRQHRYRAAWAAQEAGQPSEAMISALLLQWNLAKADRTHIAARHPPISCNASGARHWRQALAKAAKAEAKAHAKARCAA